MHVKGRTIIYLPLQAKQTLLALQNFKNQTKSDYLTVVAYHGWQHTYIIELPGICIQGCFSKNVHASSLFAKGGLRLDVHVNYWNWSTKESLKRELFITYHWRIWGGVCRARATPYGTQFFCFRIHFQGRIQGGPGGPAPPDHQK